jgi:hypothetical protein
MKVQLYIAKCKLKLMKLNVKINKLKLNINHYTLIFQSLMLNMFGLKMMKLMNNQLNNLVQNPLIIKYIFK